MAAERAYAMRFPGGTRYVQQKKVKTVNVVENFAAFIGNPADQRTLGGYTKPYAERVKQRKVAEENAMFRASQWEARELNGD